MLTVDRLRGYLTSAFTFDKAGITGLSPPNGPTTGGFNITMQGENFGDNPNYEYSGQIGESKCTLMAWTSDSAITCSIGLGIATSHVPRFDVSWNKATTRNVRVLFSFNAPQIINAVPNLVPASGGISVSVFGSNFGAFQDFKYQDSLLRPPKAKVGDTPCFETQWYSDSSVVCTVLGNGQGSGPGVGGKLPLELRVGYQSGFNRLPFGYTPPDVKYADAINGPALGGNIILITGDQFGTVDYSPTAKVGDTDCKLTRWVSNTAIRCTVPRCTKFLAGGNIELPLQVEVGLGHRVTSYQIGTRENFYFFDLPIELPFRLTNNEINMLAFASAVILAGAIILCFHSRYRKMWQPPAPSMPSRYAATRHNQLDKFKVTRKITAEGQAGMYHAESDSSKEGSTDGDGFYEFTDAYREPHSKTSEMEALFKRGQEAARTVYAGERKYQVSQHSHKAVYLSQCRRHIMWKRNSLYASQRIVAKDVVTGNKWHDSSEKGPTIAKNTFLTKVWCRAPDAVRAA